MREPTLKQLKTRLAANGGTWTVDIQGEGRGIFNLSKGDAIRVASLLRKMNPLAEVRIKKLASRNPP